MIRHVVMFWLKDEANVEETIGILLSMRGKIPGLLKIEAGKDILRSDRSCDICLHTVFTDRGALDAYQSHPAHMPVRKHMHGVMTRSASADFEVTAV